MKKQKKIKIIISVLIFIIGTVVSIYFSVYIDELLSKGEIDPNVFKMKNLIRIVKNNLKVLKLFGCLELLMFLGSLSYVITNDRFYESDLIEITPEIKIPVATGQNQFGSARFMTEKEKNKLNPLQLKEDARIKELLKHGYDDVKNIAGGDKK